MQRERHGYAPATPLPPPSLPPHPPHPVRPRAKLGPASGQPCHRMVQTCCREKGGKQPCARGEPPSGVRTHGPVHGPQCGAPSPRRHAGWCAHAVGTWVGSTCGCSLFCLVAESKQAGSSRGQLGRAASCRRSTRRGRHAEPHRHQRMTRAQRDHRSVRLPKLAAAPKLPAPSVAEAARPPAEAARAGFLPHF